MAHAAGLIILAPENAVPLHPKVIVTGRFPLTIHVDMAHQAILLCVVRIIADSHDISAAQLRHGSQVLGQHFSVAIFAFIRQCFGMDKHLLPGRGRFRFPIHFESRELLFLMAVTAGFLADFLGLHLFMTVNAGFMRHDRERRFAEFSMTFITLHFIFGDMEIVVHPQSELLFVTADQQRCQQQE